MCFKGELRFSSVWFLFPLDHLARVIYMKYYGLSLQGAMVYQCRTLFAVSSLYNYNRLQQDFIELRWKSPR